MNYSKAYQEAQRKGQTTKETIEIFNFSEEDNLVVGKFLGSEARPSEEFGGEYYVHTFDTDNGPISIAPGVIVDKVLLQDEMKGKVFAITFLGKEESKKGKHFNNFKVESFPYATE